MSILIFPHFFARARFARTCALVVTTNTQVNKNLRGISYSTNLHIVLGRGQKVFYSVVVIIIFTIAILKLVPIPVKEELVTRTFTLDYYGFARTTLNVREKATVSGTYSKSPTWGATTFSIQIIAPDQETIIWEESGSSSGSFKFIADVSGSYNVIIQNGLPDEIIVQFTASQSYQKTLI